MTVLQMKVKEVNTGGSAPLQNLNLLEALMVKAINRPSHLPGIVTFSGPSGFGKSTAAAYVSSKYNAAYLEWRSSWNKKAFVEAFARELGITPARTIPGIVDQISEELIMTERPVVLDEFDHAVGKDGFVELVRDIYEQSKASIALIGEEGLPQKLKRWERFDGRILSFEQAQPANLKDARSLNHHYTPGVSVEDDLLETLVSLARGSIRRIVTNLNEIGLFAEGEGLKKIGSKEWGNRPLQKSVAPPTRSF